MELKQENCCSDKWRRGYIQTVKRKIKSLHNNVEFTLWHLIYIYNTKEISVYIICVYIYSNRQTLHNMTSRFVAPNCHNTPV